MSKLLWKNIFSFSKKKSIHQLLKTVPMFYGLSQIDLSSVSKLLHLRTYKAGETVFVEKEPGESMYIIQSGSVDIFSADNKEKTLVHLSTGDFFGEVSLVDEEPRSATAIATEECELLGFFRADLMHLIDRNPRLASFILFQLSMVLGKRLRKISPTKEIHV